MAEKKPSDADKSRISTNHAEYTLATMADRQNEMRKRGLYCDVTLEVGSKTFPAHKIMLVTFGHYFESMFSGGYMETNQLSVSMTSSVDDAAIMEIILHYAYTGKIEITKSNVQPVLHAARAFLADDLVNECKRFLQGNNVSPLLVWTLADIYTLKDNMKEIARADTLRDFAKVSKDDEFLELDADGLIDILRDDSLTVDDEREVFDAVIRWFHSKEDEHSKKDEHSREDDLTKVLRYVRLAHIDPRYLVRRIKQDSVLRKCESVLKLLEELKDYAFLPSLDKSSSLTRRRQNSPKVETLEVNFAHSYLNDSQDVYLSEDGRVIVSPPCPPIQDAKRCVSNYNVMAYKPERFWLYVPESQSWTEIARPAVPPKRAFVEADGFWFAVGGKDPSGNACREVERYEASTNEWEEVAPLPEAVWSPSIVSMAGKLYVFGGTNANGATISMQEYSIHADEWRTLRDLPGKAVGEACAYNGRIYCCCQISGESIIYAYDIASDQWVSSSTNHECLSGPVLLNGRVFVLSGKEDARVLECYNPEKDTWADCRVFPASNQYTPQSIKGPHLMSSNQIVDDPEESFVGKALPECSKQFKEILINVV